MTTSALLALLISALLAGQQLGLMGTAIGAALGYLLATTLELRQRVAQLETNRQRQLRPKRQPDLTGGPSFRRLRALLSSGNLPVWSGTIALLPVGWRLRNRRPGYGLALQGGGIGVLYLTTFTSMRLSLSGGSGWQQHPVTHRLLSWRRPPALADRVSDTAAAPSTVEGTCRMKHLLGLRLAISSVIVVALEPSDLVYGLTLQTPHDAPLSPPESTPDHKTLSLDLRTDARGANIDVSFTQSSRHHDRNTARDHPSRPLSVRLLSLLRDGAQRHSPAGHRYRNSRYAAQSPTPP